MRKYIPYFGASLANRKYRLFSPSPFLCGLGAPVRGPPALSGFRLNYIFLRLRRRSGVDWFGRAPPHPIKSFFEIGKFFDEVVFQFFGRFGTFSIFFCGLRKSIKTTNSLKTRKMSTIRCFYKRKSCDIFSMEFLGYLSVRSNCVKKRRLREKPSWKKARGS